VGRIDANWLFEKRLGIRTRLFGRWKTKPIRGGGHTDATPADVAGGRCAEAFGDLVVVMPTSNLADAVPGQRGPVSMPVVAVAGVIPVGDVVARGFLKRRNVGVQPEDVGAAPGSEGVAGADVVPEDTAVESGAVTAFAIVLEIHGSGPVVVEHIVAALLDFGLHVVVRDNKLVLMPNRGGRASEIVNLRVPEEVAIDGVGRVIDQLRILVVDQLGHATIAGTPENLGIFEVVCIRHAPVGSAVGGSAYFAGGVVPEEPVGAVVVGRLEIIVLEKHSQCQTHITQVGPAAYLAGAFLGLVHGRHDDRHQQRDNGNDDKKLDQGECSRCAYHSSPRVPQYCLIRPAHRRVRHRHTLWRRTVHYTRYPAGATRPARENTEKAAEMAFRRRSPVIALFTRATGWPGTPYLSARQKQDAAGMVCPGPSPASREPNRWTARGAGRFLSSWRSRLGVLVERIVPAFEYVLARGLLDAADVAVQPQDIQAPTGLKPLARPNVMPKDAPIPIRTAAAFSIMREVGAVGTGKEHIGIPRIGSILNAWLHVIVRDDDLGMMRKTHRVLLRQPAIGAVGGGVNELGVAPVQEVLRNRLAKVAEGRTTEDLLLFDVVYVGDAPIGMIVSRPQGPAAGIPPEVTVAIARVRIHVGHFVVVVLQVLAMTTRSSINVKPDLLAKVIPPFPCSQGFKGPAAWTNTVSVASACPL